MSHPELGDVRRSGLAFRVPSEVRPSELQTIDRVRFSVMRQCDQADHYDARGRRLLYSTRKDPGGTQPRDAMVGCDGSSPLTVSWQIDNGLQTGSKTFQPPFPPVDREAGYRIVWRHFEDRFGRR